MNVRSQGWILLGAPLPAVKRALKLQAVDAYVGPAGKRRVRAFAPEASPAELTRRISRARLVAFDEAGEHLAFAAWRAGRCKLEAELPRVLRSAGEVREASALAQRLAEAMEGEVPGAIRSGMSALDLLAATVGVRAPEVRGLDFESLRAEQGRFRDAAPDARERLIPAAAPYSELVRLGRDGKECPFLPAWADVAGVSASAGPRLLASRDADQLLERMASLAPESISPARIVELRTLLDEGPSFIVGPIKLSRIREAAQALLARIEGDGH